MKFRFKIALLAGAIAAGSFAIPNVASARSDFAITFNAGDVDMAYRDGWWDHHHRFHHWRNHDEGMWYRTHYRTYYRDWDHDRDDHYYRHHHHDRDYDRDHGDYGDHHY